MDSIGTSAIYTFGDSILDCSTYTGGPTPGALLAKNDDGLFPEFRGRDLSTALGREIPVIHRAQDGATVAALPLQIGAGPVPRDAMTMLTIGGNDLLQGLSRGAFSLDRFRQAVRAAIGRLGGTQLFIG
ncbi:MAG: SGNH/GDSL hydrolase family protein, partial [Chloroflexota bacterium]|nr:SGNH/GDSL hydrolase family protein [Chloroflexota bacterium]